MTRRELLAKLAALPALAAMRKLESVPEDIKILVLTVDSFQNGVEVELDRASVKRAVDDTFQAAGLKPPEILVLQGVEAQFIGG